MASSVTLSGDWMISRGNKRSTIGTLNLGTSYATGGVAVTAAQFGLGVLDAVDINPDSGYVPEYIASSASAGTVKLFWTGAGLSAVLAEVTNATNVSAANFTFEAVGR